MTDERAPAFDALQEAGLAAVVTIDSVEEALPLATALCEGGVQAMELTLRTPAALEAIRVISAALPDFLLGAGTVLTGAQAIAVKEAGARFGVAPGTNPVVIEAAKGCGLPFAPGIATPSDIETALASGCRVMKLFPAEAMGGLPYLDCIAAPYKHLGVRFIPLGGVNQSNLAVYASSPHVLAVGGSWLAPAALVKEARWDKIRERASRAVMVIREARREG